MVDPRVAGRPGVKWTWYEPGIIPAWVADMDLAPAAPITEEIHRYIDGGDLGYVNPLLHHERVEQACATWLAKRHGWRPPDEALRVVGDVMQGVAACIQAFTEPGDGIIIQTPVYHPFGWAIESAGRRIVEAPLSDRASGFRVTAEALEGAIAAGATMMLISNPHNPAGRVFSVEELVLIGDIAREHDLVVVSDEIHADLVYEPHRHVPIAGLGSDLADRTVTLHSASKAFNLAGIGCAVACFGSERLWTAFDRLPTSLLGHPSGVAVRATARAWEAGEAWLADTMRLLASNRARVETWAAPRLGHRPPEATYLAWLDFRALGWDEEPDERLLREARVALSPGLQFGSGGEGHARLNFATYPEVLDEILARIDSVLAED